MNQTTLPARIAAGLLLAAAAASAANAAARQSGAAEAQQAVPATVYKPAVEYRAAPAPERPDRNWKASNDTVANTNSMALTMKSMGGHAGHTMPATPTAPADPHAGHRMAPQPQPKQAHEHHGDHQ
nr:hypothetical protein [uncultured Massilia sp.]